MPEHEDKEGTDGPRPMWAGTISFGLVSVPVNLMAATRTNRTALRMVSPDGTPLKRRYFTTRDDKELEWDDIVRGYEVEKDRFVVVDDDELERLAPERSRDIDLRVFVDASELDPVFFNRAYYLTPAGDSTKAYRLLARVMEDTGRAGIATFVMRGKEYLVAITAENGILRAETLRFVDEVRDPKDVGLSEPRKAKPAEVKRFERKIESREAARLDTSELANRSEERLLKLARKKRRTGKDVHKGKVEEDGKGGGEVIDLMEMLQRSLKGGNGEEGKKARGKSGAKRAR